MKTIKQSILIILLLSFLSCSSDDGDCNCMYSTEKNSWVKASSEEQLETTEEFATQEQLDLMDKQCKAQGCE